MEIFIFISVLALFLLGIIASVIPVLPGPLLSYIGAKFVLDKNVVKRAFSSFSGFIMCAMFKLCICIYIINFSVVYD